MPKISHNSITESDFVSSLEKEKKTIFQNRSIKLPLQNRCEQRDAFAKVI